AHERNDKQNNRWKEVISPPLACRIAALTSDLLLRRRLAGAIFLIFRREERREILPEPSLRDGIVEHPHVVRPIAVAAPVGVAVEITIAGEIIPALAGVDVGLMELVVAWGTVVKQHDFRCGVAGSRHNLGGLQARNIPDR